MEQALFLTGPVVCLSFARLIICILMTTSRRIRACSIVSFFVMEAPALAPPEITMARGTNMALTKDFKETIEARAQRDSVFCKALLQEGNSVVWIYLICNE